MKKIIFCLFFFFFVELELVKNFEEMAGGNDYALMDKCYIHEVVEVELPQITLKSHPMQAIITKINMMQVAQDIKSMHLDQGNAVNWGSPRLRSNQFVFLK